MFSSFLAWFFLSFFFLFSFSFSFVFFLSLFFCFLLFSFLFSFFFLKVRVLGRTEAGNIKKGFSASLLDLIDFI